ncbi:phosphonate ABC transporter, permease protein PhnE [Nonomuraea diastatica]|uniref:Phosphonate ABC transporter, permease protein PhnE n=1 Tax=Nonomuraea diastatica TaxID=1848329 RepID=A0A4R4VTW1_9ACTN|nr:phosphonate ABC transporter, permease protein PhnE [Nonomuraea diastatica]TDD03730.1 phosphonate ABC transporter, permease protein PhnE [Nonomuraea diastatica]
MTRARSAPTATAARDHPGPASAASPSSPVSPAGGGPPARPGTAHRLRPPRTGRRAAAWGFPIVFVALGVLALDRLGVGIGGLIGGFGEVAALLARAWPPTLSDPATTLAHVLDTLWMALAGTALATVLAAVLGVLAASPVRTARSAALAVIVACRAIPDVVFAVFFVAAVGIGPLPGVLALGLHSVGMLGKLFAEAVEQADTGVREAVAGTGAGPAQRLLAGVLPQVAPAWIAAILYRLDINFRGSVLLGAVGAGGIGLDLKTAFGFTDYQEATGLALVTVAVVLLVEAVSVTLRGQLLGAGRTGIVPAEGGTRVPWTRGRLAVHLAGWGGMLLATVAFWQVGASPAALADAVGGSLRALGDFFPPDFAPVAGLLGEGLAETAAIALGATFLGTLAGVPLGLAAARAVAPNDGVRLAARTFCVGLRSIPDLLLVLVFVAAFGLMDGPVAGTLALAVCTAALVAKLVADDAEELRRGPREAVSSAGAGPAQELTVAVLGQLTPRLAATTLYALDVNLRAFFILGIVGAGELGYALSQHIRALNHDVVTAIVVPVFVLVLAVEAISARLRSVLQ